MTGRERSDEALEAFFEAARENPARVDEALSERLLAAAMAAQPRAATPETPVRQGWLRALGGWPAFTGLATATVAGVLIGTWAPTTVGDLAFGNAGSEYDFSGFIGGFDVAIEDG